MQHEVANGQDFILDMKSTSGRDPMFNMKLPMVRTLNAT